MRILHAMAGGAFGGAETFFVDAIKAIHEENIEQFVITRNNNDQKIEEIKKLDIPLEIASFGKLWRRPTRKIIEAAVSSFDPDIIHHWLGRAGSFSMKGNHINIGWYGGYYKPERFSNCQHHVAVTRDIADHIVRQGIHAENVHVLHLYAEFETAKPVNRAEFATPEGVPLLLSLSRLHPVKGLDVLLEALTAVPDAYLWIAGTGPLEKELKEQMRALGLEDRVRFLGWRYDREALLAAADICVFPSRYEAFGAVTIEAWATETPLVAAKAVGPNAYISHGENGLLTEIDDPEDLAYAVNQLIQDQKLKSTIVENGLAHYRRNFTKDVFKKNVGELYGALLH